MNDVTSERSALIHAYDAILDEGPVIATRLNKPPFKREAFKYLRTRVTIDGRVSTVMMRHWHLDCGQRKNERTPVWRQVILRERSSTPVNLYLREDGAIVYNLAYSKILIRIVTHPYPLLKRGAKELETILRATRSL